MKTINRILALSKPYWGRIIIAAICSVFASGMNGALAYLVKPAVDKVFVEKNSEYLVMIAIAVFVVYIARGIFAFCQSYLMRSVGLKIVRNIRNSLYEHATVLPMSFFGKDSTGAMISRIINDAGTIQGLLAYTVKDIFVESFTVIALVGVAMYMRWDMTLITIFGLPIALYYVSKLGKRLKSVSKRALEKISEITQILTESFMGIKIIKSFNREQDELSRFKKKNQDYYRELMRSTRIVEATSLIMEFVGGIGIAFVIWYGGSFVIKGNVTPGEFFSFMTAIFMIYTPAKRLVNANNNLHQAGAPLDRIDKLLAENKESGTDTELKNIDKEIVFKNISFRYENTKEDALEDVNLSVKKGEIIALVGKSGAGKSTFVDLISRFYDPIKGEILIDGYNISRVSLKSLRHLIGIVSQDIILFNDTVRANIAYGRKDATEKDIVNAAKAAFAHEFILELPQGYDTIIGERGIRISGGQKQRLSIARAILKNPPILILDEATSSLDTASEMMVQKALETLMEGRTTFVIAHRLSTVRKADRIIVFDKGKITESGTHNDLIKNNGIYKKLHNLQFNDSADI
ncbi:MAG: ABC transporter ATP-binding protein/permease [Nitrospiraceae bacterium]|nr:ABC transporter ATP-binding protein/permease [Nitrospiraceae bacterium]